MAAGGPPQALEVGAPPWVARLVEWDGCYPTDEDRMRLAVSLARENVLREGGGPFGAVVFEAGQGRAVAAGVNSVTRLGTSVLHAEVMAIMLAQHRVGSYTLAAAGLPRHELVTSCEPCAMCLGAAFWSGVRRLVCGATRDDAMGLGFDEGPVFPASYEYLAARDITVTRQVLRPEAREVLELYLRQGGAVYNP